MGSPLELLTSNRLMNHTILLKTAITIGSFGITHIHSRHAPIAAAYLRAMIATGFQRIPNPRRKDAPGSRRKDPVGEVDATSAGVQPSRNFIRTVGTNSSKIGC